MFFVFGFGGVGLCTFTWFQNLEKLNQMKMTDLQFIIIMSADKIRTVIDSVYLEHRLKLIFSHVQLEKYELDFVGD